MLEVEVREALENPNKFNELFKGQLSEVRSASIAYPDLKNGLFNAVLTLHWDGLVKNNSDVIAVAGIFQLPEMKLQLIEKLRSTEMAQFKQYAQTISQFRHILENVSTVNHEEEQLVEKLFFDSEINKYLSNHLMMFDQNSTLIRLIDIGKDYCKSEKIKSKVAEEIVNTLSSLSEGKLTQLMSSPTEFRYAIKVIKDSSSELFLARVFESSFLRRKFFKNASDYLKFAENASPEFLKKIANLIPLDTSKLKEVFMNGLRSGNPLFQSSNINDILSRIDSSADSMQVLVSDISFLISIAEDFPDLKPFFEKKIDPDLLIAKWLQEYSLSKKDNIALFQKHYPNLKLVSSLTSHTMDKLINSEDDFECFVRGVTENEKNALFDLVLAKHSGFNEIYNIKKLVKLFPESTKEILKRIMEKDPVRVMRNEYDLMQFIAIFQADKEYILDWSNQPEQRERFSTFSALILSVQKPHNTELDGVQAGKSGLMIQSVNNGGYIYVHRDKQLSSEDKVILDQHLHPNGWLIVTGHGDGEGEQMKGGYHVDRSNTVDISLTPEELTNLLISSNRLKSGDHINIVLYSCYAAEGNPSYAENLANQLDRQGISSRIFASDNTVGRIGEYLRCDIPGSFIWFRTQGVKYLFSKEKDQPVRTMLLNEDVYFGKDKIYFSKNINELVVHHLIGEIKRSLLKIDFEQDQEKVKNKLIKYLEPSYYCMGFSAVQDLLKSEDCIVFQPSGNPSYVYIAVGDGKGSLIQREFMLSYKKENDEWHIKLSDDAIKFIQYNLKDSKQMQVEGMFESIKKECLAIDPSPRHFVFNYFNTNAESASKLVVDDKNLIIVRKSSDVNFISVTFYNNGPKHGRLKFIKYFQESGDPVWILDNDSRNSLRNVVKYPIDSSTAPSLGANDQLTLFKPAEEKPLSSSFSATSTPGLTQKKEEE